MPTDPAGISLHVGDVVLRPLGGQDAPLLARAAAESRDHYRFTQVPDGEAEAAAYVEQALAAGRDGQRLPFAITWHGRVVGTTSFTALESRPWPAGSPFHGRTLPDAVEIGHTWLAASAQRTVVNTSAKYLLLRHAFDTWQVRRVRLRTDSRNLRSQRDIARLGLRRDGILRAEKLGADGAVRDSVCFSLLAEEWPAAAVELVRRLTGTAAT